MCFGRRGVDPDTATDVASVTAATSIKIRMVAPKEVQGVFGATFGFAASTMVCTM